jgi:4-hydroxybenzoate polyprenyltransferase
LVSGLLASLRPKQWTKNLLVFAGYLFTIEQKHPEFTWLKVLAAFGLFCAISGAGYIFNDALDVERDRRHPRKCKRPIASGRVPARMAVTFAVVLASVAVAASFLLDVYFGLLATTYLLLTTGYTLGLKHIVIVDVLAITAGFVIRAVAGAVVVFALDAEGVARRVEISPWLLVCTTLLALFLASAKRRAELSLDDSSKHRRTLDEYTAPLLDQMINISAAACLMGYFLYTFTPASKTGAAHPHMMITIPFVMYGLFRYLYLIHTKNAGGSPEQLLIEDKPLLINIVLYVIAVVVAFKW